MSDVPRSLQNRVSTIHTVVLTADVFQLFIKSDAANCRRRLMYTSIPGIQKYETRSQAPPRISEECVLVVNPSRSRSFLLSASVVGDDRCSGSPT